MQIQDYKKLFKKANIQLRTTVMSSKISGVTSTISNGITFSSIYPWKKWYTQNGKRLAHIVDDKFQDVIISQTGNKNQMLQVIAVLQTNKIKFQLVDGGVQVKVSNPYSTDYINRINNRK